MEIDQSIAKLAEKLDAWFDGNTTTFASADRTAQGRAIDRGVTIVREFERIKNTGLKLLNSLMANYTSIPENQKTISLITAFELGAKLAAALHDELLDTNGENKVLLLMNDVAAALDKTAQGRSVLSELLGRSDPRVRASAGAYLLIVNLLPNSVVPVLREIEQAERGNTAGFTAHWALLDWEQRQKAVAINNNK